MLGSEININLDSYEDWSDSYESIVESLQSFSKNDCFVLDIESMNFFIEQFHHLNRLFHDFYYSPKNRLIVVRDILESCELLKKSFLVLSSEKLINAVNKISEKMNLQLDLICLSSLMDYLK